MFRKYYALRASASVNRGAQDEWNIVRMINYLRKMHAFAREPFCSIATRPVL